MDKDLSQTEKVLLFAGSTEPKPTDTDKLLAKLSDIFIGYGGDQPIDNGGGYESRIEREEK